MGSSSSADFALVEQTLTRCGIQVSPALVESVGRYVDILQRWNQKINLTGITSLSEILTVHFAESFFAARMLGEKDSPILDIGSGAGFPGLAMKLYRPEFSFYLVELRKKKAAFLSTVRRELALERVSILNKRLEECQPSDFIIPPRVLTVRAVGGTENLIQVGLRFLPEQAKVVVFCTTGQVKTLISQLTEIEWEEPVLIPWSRERMLLLGQRLP
jgi:16S rRNA (guanine(527)-N(7))-methyltransferase RsmG